MRIVEGAFFGNIRPSVDPKTRKNFFRYYIGKRYDGDLLFDGVAGDEKEAVETVTAHLLRLAMVGRCENTDTVPPRRRRDVNTQPNNACTTRS